MALEYDYGWSKTYPQTNTIIIFKHKMIPPLILGTIQITRRQT